MCTHVWRSSKQASKQAVESMSRFLISVFHATIESVYVNICTRRPHAYHSLVVNGSNKHMPSPPTHG
jgi:hypothetical protein